MRRMATCFWKKLEGPFLKTYDNFFFSFLILFSSHMILDFGFDRAWPIDITRCKDSLLGLSRVKMLRTLVALSSMELPLGLLVLVLNVIFIFFGRNTGWYYFVDSLGTELKVVGVQRKAHILDILELSRRRKDKYVPQISVGEGIVSGLLYLALSATSLAILLRVIFKRNLHVYHLVFTLPSL